MSFYEFLRTAPFIRLLIPFIIGILTAQYIQLEPPYYRLVFFSLHGIIVIFFFFNPGKRFRVGWIWGLLLNIYMVVLGLFISSMNANKASFPKSEVIAVGTVIENPVEKDAYYHVSVKLVALKDGAIWEKVGHKVQCTLRKNGLNDSVYLGQQLVMRGSWSEIRNLGNPFEFDYKKYMNQLGFFYRAVLDSCSWHVNGKSDFMLTVWALKIRNRLLDYFRQLNLGQSAFAVISALTVGDKSYLDPELKAVYTNTGTIHILAVSGMHVALLFWLLQQITRPLMIRSKGKIIRAILVLVIIWTYALVTGLTPSVVRASVMFSFWMLGDTGNRTVNIYNTLSASALLLLFFNPQTLFNIGFQLSYMAVLGIVVFYKDIFNWIYIRNRALKEIWSWVAVSFAAQLFTIPLTLYYFHQFPNYFLLSNIVALPLSTLILYACVLALLIAPLEFLWLPIGWLLKGLVALMNYVLIWVEHLPFSVSSGITISGIVAFSIFLVIVSVRIFISNKKALPIMVILCCCIISSLDISRKRVSTLTTSDMVVYNSSSSYLVQIRNGYDSYIITPHPDVKHERLLKPYNEHYHLKNVQKIFLDSNKVDFHRMVYKKFVFHNDKRIYIWDKTPRFNKQVKVDILIVCNIKLAEVKYLDKYISPKEVVVAHDVTGRVLKSIQHLYSAKKVPCKVLKSDGAWFFSHRKNFAK